MRPAKASPAKLAPAAQEHSWQASRAVWVGAFALGLQLATGEARAELRVVVTSKPAHSLVAAVMGASGSSRVLIDGSASPHTYVMRPSDARAVAEADVFFRVSQSLEPFTAKLVQALPKSVRVATLSEAPGLTLLARRPGGVFEADGQSDNRREIEHDHGSSAGWEDRDPHIWLDPRNAKAMARYVATVLGEKAPTLAASFKANAELLSRRIDDLDAELALKLEPLAGKPFIVFHDAYQYLERRYGLATAGAITIGPDLQPGAKRLTELRNRIGRLGAACVFAEPQFEPRLVTAVVEGTNTRSGTLDPEGMGLSPGPELYFRLMRRLAADLRYCVDGS